MSFIHSWVAEDEWLLSNSYSWFLTNFAVICFGEKASSEFYTHAKTPQQQLNKATLWTFSESYQSNFQAHKHFSGSLQQENLLLESYTNISKELEGTVTANYSTFL